MPQTEKQRYLHGNLSTLLMIDDVATSSQLVNGGYSATLQGIKCGSTKMSQHLSHDCFPDKAWLTLTKHTSDQVVITLLRTCNMTAGSKYSTCRRAMIALSCAAWHPVGSMLTQRFSKLKRSTVSRGTSLHPPLRADLAAPAAVMAG